MNNTVLFSTCFEPAMRSMRPGLAYRLPSEAVRVSGRNGKALARARFPGKSKAEY
jgi:hypothetical protein